VEQQWRTAAAAGVSYKEAGVDIDAGEELVRRIGPACKATARSGVFAAAAERVPRLSFLAAQYCTSGSMRAWGWVGLLIVQRWCAGAEVEGCLRLQGCRVPPRA
jgi:hypothetical protein